MIIRISSYQKKHEDKIVTGINAIIKDHVLLDKDNFKISQE